MLFSQNCRSSQAVIRDPHGNARTKDEVREAFGSSSVDECPDSPESLDQMLNRKNFVKSKSLNQKIEELKVKHELVNSTHVIDLELIVESIEREVRICR